MTLEIKRWVKWFQVRYLTTRNHPGIGITPWCIYSDFIFIYMKRKSKKKQFMNASRLKSEILVGVTRFCWVEKVKRDDIKLEEKKKAGGKIDANEIWKKREENSG